MSFKRNPNLGPSHMRAKRRRLFFIRFYIILFLLLVVTISLAILSGHEKVKIQTILISGNAAVANDEILDIVNRDMAGRYFYLFSKSDSLIFPRFRIKTDILQEIKTIKDVDISWENWQTISVLIKERRPHSVWCGNDMTVNATECYFVDKDGYIYGFAPAFSGNLFLKDYSTILTESPIGNYFLPTKTYIQIYNLTDILDQRGLRVLAVSYDDFDYKFILEAGPVIIFNNKNSFETSFGNLFTALETKDLDFEKEAELINYIDLRFANKIVIGKK